MPGPLGGHVDLVEGLDESMNRSMAAATMVGRTSWQGDSPKRLPGAGAVDLRRS